MCAHAHLRVCVQTAGVCASCEYTLHWCVILVCYILVCVWIVTMNAYHYFCCVFGCVCFGANSPGKFVHEAKMVTNCSEGLASG